MRNTECGLFIALMYSLEYANIHSNHVLYLLCGSSGCLFIPPGDWTVCDSSQARRHHQRPHTCFSAGQWKQLLQPPLRTL